MLTLGLQIFNPLPYFPCLSDAGFGHVTHFDPCLLVDVMQRRVYN